MVGLCILSFCITQEYPAPQNWLGAKGLLTQFCPEDCWPQTGLIPRDMRGRTPQFGPSPSAEVNPLGHCVTGQTLKKVIHFLASGGSHWPVQCGQIYKLF